MFLPALLLAVIGVGLFLVNPRDERLSVLRDVERFDSRSLLVRATRFEGRDRVAIEGFAKAGELAASDKPLDDFASALVLAGAVSGAWAEAFIKVGRGDIATKLANLLVGLPADAVARRSS